MWFWCVAFLMCFSMKVEAKDKYYLMSYVVVPENQG